MMNPNVLRPFCGASKSLLKNRNLPVFAAKCWPKCSASTSSRSDPPELIIPGSYRKKQDIIGGKGKVEENSGIVDRMIREKIKLNGPITLADYMRFCLKSPTVGYYARQSQAKPDNILGAGGDFITSPELSPIFGELIGAWICYELRSIGFNSEMDWQLVELGPGSGALSSKILETIHRLGKADLWKNFTRLSLVEMSDQLARQQCDALCSKSVESSEHMCYMSGRSKYSRDISIEWYRDIADVPDGIFTVFVANEFFDALPIHQFLREPATREWRELVVGVDGDKLKPGFSQTETLHTKSLLPEKVRKDESRNVYEVCPDAGVICSQLVERLNGAGGVCLMVDYGHDGQRNTSSFRAYHRHKQVECWQREAGSCDLTADVDFSSIRSVMEQRDPENPDSEPKSCVFGPITQREFLKEMGVDLRLEQLKKTTDAKSYEVLEQNTKLLIDPDEMGDKFKVMAAFPGVTKEIFEFRKRPSGFPGSVPLSFV